MHILIHASQTWCREHVVRHFWCHEQGLQLVWSCRCFVSSDQEQICIPDKENKNIRYTSIHLFTNKRICSVPIVLPPVHCRSEDRYWKGSSVAFHARLFQLLTLSWLLHCLWRHFFSFFSFNGGTGSSLWTTMTFLSYTFGIYLVIVFFDFVQKPRLFHIGGSFSFVGHARYVLAFLIHLIARR